MYKQFKLTCIHTLIDLLIAGFLFYSLPMIVSEVRNGLYTSQMTVYRKNGSVLSIKSGLDGCIVPVMILILSCTQSSLFIQCNNVCLCVLSDHTYNTGYSHSNILL